MQNGGYNPADWYWSVGDHAELGLFSSARGVYVNETDDAYLAWRGDLRVPSSMPTEAELLAYLSNLVPGFVASTKEGLIAYAAAARYAHETGGISIGGMAVATDRVSQAMIGNAYNMASHDASFSTKWKNPDGSFATLNAATIIAIAVAVGSHVAACFSKEADVVAAINASPPTIASIADIDTAFAAVA